uniref:Small ribosomal subunit protein eS6 n=1 Tax=Ursus americanus TaxID=9643 RepID=A0A452QG58_URSAM
MKLNISFSAPGCQKCNEMGDKCKLRTFYEKRMATELVADAVGEECKGYVVRISGGNNKQGFPLKQMLNQMSHPGAPKMRLSKSSK